MQPIDPFTRAYIEAALWSSTDNADDSGGEPLDANYTAEDIAPETLAQMIKDCKAFQAAHADLFTGCKRSSPEYTNEERSGHDFWLTRERHGAGFWDGDWPEPAATVLTDAAHAYGGFDLYVGDDGLIYN